MSFSPLHILLTVIVLTLPSCNTHLSPKHASPRTDEIDIRHFGATGDGQTIDSGAINKAIEAAHAAGGGTVQIPAGTYLCYSIRVQSNVSLYLNPGATILAAPPPTPPSSAPAYDEPEANPFRPYQGFGQSHAHNSLIWADKAENVSILGPGVIDGAGRLFKDQGGRPWGVANKAIALRLCRNVTIRDISIRTAGHFAILTSGVDNLTIDNVKVDTDRDGIDIDCSRNVHISNCSVNTPNDDAICLKSTYTLGEVRATENVTITNCHVSGYAVGAMLDGTFRLPDSTPKQNGGPMGRIKLGTESVGGFRNIAISNCTFDHCHGLALINVDGGELEDVAISNITMRHIAQAPFFFRLGNRLSAPKSDRVGSIRRVSISNVMVYDDEASVCSIFAGLPGQKIEDVSLSNVRIVTQGGGTAAQAALQPEEREKNYPEPNMFGEMPAYGFFMRHAGNITMNNVTLSFMKEDARPPLVLHDVNGIRFDALTAQRAPNVPAIKLKQVQNLELHQSAGLSDTHIPSTEQGEVKGQ